MEFESPDVEKDFPGLYASESSRRSDSDYGDSSQERGKKELLRSKRRDKKEKNKDKGYAALGEDSSVEEMDLSDTRNPLKPKKPKSFKFLHKKDKEEKEKEDRREDKKCVDKKEEKKKEKEEKKKEKEKEKEEKKREKEQKKKSKKDKKKKPDQQCEEADDKPVFGVPLSLAVKRCPSHDGLKLPAVVRECIDFIEDYGLSCEGIYRLSGVKSKVQQLRRAYNLGDPVRLIDQEPHVIASLLKQFLRELPEPVLTDDMMPHFEDVCLIPNPSERAEAIRQLIDRLPTPNRLLLQYMFKHMGHVISREKETKMTYQNVCIVLSPTMQISHRILNVMFLNHAFLFSSVVMRRYVPPIASGGEKQIDLLDSVQKIEEEMSKQESLLATLHAQVTAGQVSQKREERLWEAQRIVTLLKRKLKVAQRRESEYRDKKTGEESSWSLEKDVSSEDSQREGLSLESGSKETSQQETIAEEVADVKEDQLSTDVYYTESETDSGTPKQKTSENVTVVSVQSDTPSDSNASLSKAINDPPLDVPAENKQQHAIPVLPKPYVSSRNERVRQLHSLHDSHKFDPNAGDSTSSSNESIKAGEQRPSKLTHSIHQVEVLEEPSRNCISLVEEPPSHVTVIQVGQIHTVEDPLPSECKDELNNIGQYARNAPIESSVSLDNKVLLSDKKLQNQRLNIDKVPLRETRSLEEYKINEDDLEYESLIKEESYVEAEHLELLSMNHDLTKKLQAERAEIGRLKDEIEEMQTLYGYRTYSYDSSESEGTESEGESDTEDDLLQHLVTINHANTKLKNETSLLTRRIQEEREVIVKLRVKLRQVQIRPPHPTVTTVY